MCLNTKRIPVVPDPDVFISYNENSYTNEVGVIIIHKDKSHSGPVGSISKKILPSDVVTLWPKSLRERLISNNPEQQYPFDDIMTDVRALGETLFRDYLPEDIQHLAKDWPEMITIAVSSSISWFPWELVHDGENFWGIKFNIYHEPRKPVSMRLTGTQNEPLSYPKKEVYRRGIDVINLKTILSVIGESIHDYAAFDGPFSGINLDGISVQYQYKPDRTTLIQKMCDSQIVYFLCDCDKDALELIISKSDPVNRLNIDHIMLDDLNVYGSLIFANASFSALEQYDSEKIRTFGNAFFQKQAAAFIGLVGEISPGLAFKFSIEFYRQLFISDLSVGAALMHTRRTMKERSEPPYWLLYTLFGGGLVPVK